MNRLPVGDIKILLMAVLPSIPLAGCNTSPQAAPANHAESSLRQVKAMAAELKPVDQVAVVTGTLGAGQEIILGFKVPGRLAEITVDLGSSVQKNQPLARLDTTDFELRVRQAEAALLQVQARLGLAPDAADQSIDISRTPLVKEALAELEAAQVRLDRARQLFNKGLLPKADFDTATSGYRVADAKYEDSIAEARNRQALLAQRRSELEIARRQLADAVLYAPVSGMIRQRSANVGQYLIDGAQVLVLVQMHPLRLRTSVPEREALNLKIGQPVRLTVEGSSGVHQGQIARISPSFDETNRTLLVETEVSNPAGALRPGGFARAEIVVSSTQRALIVPAGSLVSFAGVDRVFTVQNGKVAEKRVKTGRRTEAWVQILEGILPGDQVVLDPGNLADGEQVTQW